MNYCGIQQNGVVSCEETRSFVSVSGGRKGSVVCPKPRRVAPTNDASRPMRWHFGYSIFKKINLIFFLFMVYFS